MRIAYITLHWPRKKASGIGRKIEEQISAWRQSGHTVQLFSHRIPVKNTSELVEGIGFEYEEAHGIAGLLITEINRSRAILPLVNAVREFKPDIIYLRWSMYVFPAHRLFRIAPVVIEINTDDVSQHEMLGPLLSFYNQMTRTIFLRKAAGLVFTSKELQTCASYAPFHRPGVVIANGIDLSKNPAFTAPVNPRPRVGFIGTPDMSWQGVDKIIRLAELCPDLDFDIIGFEKPLEGTSLPANIIFHGYLDTDKARTVLAGDDVGLGTLALHRKSMQEASSLKIREYLAYGIPVIIPYIDTDLDDLKTDTILRIPNTEDNIEQAWQTIHDFACKMKGRRIDRGLISSRIDTQHKEKLRLDFFKSCIRGPRLFNE
ncbi:MAG: glycosyltransferase family 4 protein [Leptolinea sp.]|jgi:hypothetical protein|nr:glycosyltransferase family 4 protein [Leptolinea sp.]